MTDDAPHAPHTPPPAADPQSIEGLFLQALGQSAEQRADFLNEACGDDADRRRRIEALLRAYEDAGSFLEKPPAGVDTSATLSLEFLTPSDDPGLLGMLGPYEVYEVLGRGGMGIVFRARDPKLNRVVAIKVLAPELAANPNARRRFLREAKTAASISHPHVVTIHAVDEGVQSPESRVQRTAGAPLLSSQHSTLPFLVMECIVGQTLQQKLDKQGSLRLTEILRIGHQTAQGLAAAHRQGLIHRDIKPANILLENGVERVKITDFGLARAADDVSITRTGEVSGTPQYMSPEQASGGTIDHRSDLFSLGCVLYAMCTGRSPFRATTLAAAIRRVCDDAPRPIEEINPEAPQWLIDIVNRLLAKDPDERIQSADEVAELLGDHLAGIQHPPRVRTIEPPRPRSVAAVPQPAVAAKSARGLGMNVPLRVLLWLGAIALLIPIFYAVGGTAIGAGGDALEGAVIAAIICWPIALGLFAVALLDRSLQGHPYANALFLLVCILLGPIGILLYLVRRDQYLLGTSQPPGEPASRKQSLSDEQSLRGPGEKGGSANVPQWLLTPLPGPVKLLALLLGVVAAVVMGQAIEQWSDVDQATGTFLFINAVVLALLAAWIAVAAGVRFDARKGVLLAVAAGALMYLGARAPDREFKLGLARMVQSSTAIAWITGGVILLAAWIAYCVYAAIYSRNDDRSPAERLGRGLVIGGIGLWALLAAWMLAVGEQIVPPPPLAHSELTGDLIMFTVVYIGGGLFALGMILSGWVVTPGMVRQFAAGKDVRSSDAGGLPAATTDSGTSAAASPWRVLGGMLIAGLVIVPGCLIVGLGVPYLSLANSDIGVVQIEFDNARPISSVTARGDVGAAHSEQRVTEHAVTTNPFHLQLPAGVYDLTMTWQAEGLTGTFVQRARVEASRTKRLDVSQNVARVLQSLGDRRQDSDDGYSPPRTIPLGQAGQSGAEKGGGMLPPLGDDNSGIVPLPPMGAVMLTIADPGLFVVFDRAADDAADADAGVDGPVVGMGMGMSMGPGMTMGGVKGANASGTVKLPEGTYRVLVTDQRAGWGGATELSGFGMVELPHSQIRASELPERLQVVAGEFRNLTVSRDLKRVADLQPDWQQRGFFAFRWNGATYDLTQTQAVAVQRLLEARLTDAPDVHAALLLAPAGISAETRKLEPLTLSQEDAQAQLAEREQPTLESLFNEGQHPAWGTMIVPGEAAGSYRLAELQAAQSGASPSALPPGMSALQIDFDDPGLSLSLEREDKGGTKTVGPFDEPMTITLQPGNYRVMVEDDLAGWRTTTEYGEPDVVWYEFDRFEIAAGETQSLTVDRNLYKMGATYQGGGQLWRFLWNGQTYELDHNQALAVARLLHALADGSTTVHEGRLLRQPGPADKPNVMPPMSDDVAEGYRAEYAANGNTLKNWFQSGQHPAWGTLIVEGEKPNTYRLAELVVPEPAASTDASAAGLAITVETPGLIARIYSADTDEPRQPLHEITDSAIVTLSSGRYDVWVEDTLAGWHGLNSDGEPGPVQYRYEMLRVMPPDRAAADATERRQVVSGETTSLKISRNLQKLASGLKPEEGRAQRFRWQQQSYNLTNEQWPVVAILLKAYADGRPDVHEAQLLSGATFRGSEVTLNPLTPRDPDEALKRLRDDGHSLEVHFEDGQHPAWGTLIVEGEKPNTYRLAELQTADRNEPPQALSVIYIRYVDTGLSAMLVPVESADGSSAHEGPGRWLEGESIVVPAGAYRITVQDDLAGWSAETHNGQPDAVRYEFDRIRLARRAAINLKIDRDFSRMAAAYPRDIMRGTHRFRWSGQTYTLSSEQAIYVAFLLKAYADGDADVHEGRLLTGGTFKGGGIIEWSLPPSGDAEQALAKYREDGHSLKGLFDDGKHPAWGTLIVEGEKPDTWRLAPLQIVTSPREQE